MNTSWSKSLKKHMTLDYFYGQAGELFSFYRIPKALFQEPRFRSLSTDAKLCTVSCLTA